MRITNSMVVNNMMYNMGNNLERLDSIKQKLATGKKIATPSDNPIIASRALKLRTDVAEVQQFGKNVDDANSWLDITESTLGTIGDVLQRVRELAVEAGSDSMAPDDRKKVATEVAQLRGQIIQQSNTTYAGRYIFSGYETDKTLIDQTTGFYNIKVETTGALREDIKYEIGIGDKININALGSEVFGGSGDAGTTPKMIEDLDNLITALNTSDVVGIGNSLTKIDENIDTVLMVRSDIGARANRLELTKNRLMSDETNFTKLMSQNEDADMAEVIMKLKSEENVYQASLSGGARIIQTTLIDFLK